MQQKNILFAQESVANLYYISNGEDERKFSSFNSKNSSVKNTYLVTDVAHHWGQESIYP